jgi:hypothetical protein
MKFVISSGVALNVWYLLQQVPGDVWLIAIPLAFIVVLLVLTNEKACNRLIRVLETLRKKH